jgi:hypothetical protein
LVVIVVAAGALRGADWHDEEEQEQAELRARRERAPAPALTHA